MTYRLLFTNQASKDINNLRPNLKIRIEKALDLIANNPYQGKPLKGDYKNYWSYRVGDYRIIYEIRKVEIVVIILKVAHRRESYR